MKKQLGSSLVELSVAMVIGSLVLSSAFQAQRAFSLSAENEKRKMLFQNEAVVVSELLAKDIRTTGYGVQSTPISAELNTSESDQIDLFSNIGMKKTELIMDRTGSDSVLIVRHIDSISDGWWVSCLNDRTSAMRQIKRIGKKSNSYDTLFLDGPLITGPFGKSSTSVSFASLVEYKVTNGKLSRIKNGVSRQVGCLIDTMDIVITDAKGAALTASQLQNAQTVTIYFGSHFKSGKNMRLLMDKVEVNLRNRS